MSRFAWWDTVRDEFESFSDEQAWDTWEEFKEAFDGDQSFHGPHNTRRADHQAPGPGNLLDRYEELCPKWVFDGGHDDIDAFYDGR